MSFGDFIIVMEDVEMNKAITMSIRVSEEELIKLKQAARIESYSSYSEFVRRTALVKANEVIEKECEKK